jgi:hypothetical protein
VETIIHLWDQCNQLSQTAIAVGGVLVVYLLVRWVVLHRMERFASQTTNDLDDRLVDFIKQFLWLIALFVAVLLALRINGIQSRRCWPEQALSGLPWGWQPRSCWPTSCPASFSLPIDRSAWAIA